MKLSEWAKKQGISYKTAWRWVRQNRMPVPFEQTPSKTILVKELENKSNLAAIYARVSSTDQKLDLDRQIARLANFASERGLLIGKIVAEVGSGLNGRRPKLIRLLADPEVNTIIVEHRDRLARFGFEYIEAALWASGRKIIVLDLSETTDDLVQDMIEVLTSFCARLYGKRGARNRARQALEVIQDVNKTRI